MGPEQNDMMAMTTKLVDPKISVMVSNLHVAAMANPVICMRTDIFVFLYTRGENTKIQISVLAITSYLYHNCNDQCKNYPKPRLVVGVHIYVFA